MEYVLCGAHGLGYVAGDCEVRRKIRLIQRAEVYVGVSGGGGQQQHTAGACVHVSSSVWFTRTVPVADDGRASQLRRSDDPGPRLQFEDRSANDCLWLFRSLLTCGFARQYSAALAAPLKQ